MRHVISVHFGSIVSAMLAVGVFWWVGEQPSLVRVEVPAPGSIQDPGLQAPSWMAIERDPETGGWKPATRVDFQPTGPGGIDLNQSIEDLPIVVMPDGSLMVDLQGRFASFSVVRRDASGRLVFGCIHDRKEFERFLDPAGAAPASHPER